jgi:hypothetical protein
MAVLEVPFVYVLAGTMTRCRNQSVASVVDVVPVAVRSVDGAQTVATWHGPDDMSGVFPLQQAEIPFRSLDGVLWTPVRVAVGAAVREATANDLPNETERWLSELRRNGRALPYPLAPSWMTPNASRRAASAMTQAEADERFRRIDASTRQAARAETARLARQAIAEIGGVLHVRTVGPVWTPYERVPDSRMPPVSRLVAGPGSMRAGNFAVHPIDEPDRALARFSAAARADRKTFAGFSDEASVEIPDVSAYRAVRPDATQIVLQAAAMHYCQRNTATWQRVGYLPGEAALAAAELRAMGELGTLTRPDAVATARARVLLGRIHGCYPLPVPAGDGLEFQKSPWSAALDVIRWLGDNPPHAFADIGPANGPRTR